MQIDEGATAPSDKQHLDLSMTKRLFVQLNSERTPNSSDFQREYDALSQLERRVAGHLLEAVKVA